MEIRDNLIAGDSLVFYNANKKSFINKILLEPEIPNLKDFGTPDHVYVDLPGTWVGDKIGVIYKSIDGRNSDAFSDMFEITE